MHTNLAVKAKAMLEAYIPLIEKKLAKYFDLEIDLNFGFNRRQKSVVKELLIHSKEHNLRPAKRLRGSFVHYGYLLGGGQENDKVWSAAMAVEIVHTALLMHDDFMDRDITRRGGQTTHKYYEAKDNNPHYGNSMAVTTGDTVLCAGFDLLNNVVKKTTMHQMLRAIVNTAHGQAYDITLETLGKWHEDDVINLHIAKTAIYTYENPLVIGARMAELSEDVLLILHNYAFDGGVAFQLQDDILGVFGTPEKTGKSADSDLLQGKCTMLVLKVFNDGTPRQQKAVKKVWGKMEATQTDLSAAKQAIIDSGSLKYSNDVARRYAMKAVKTASKLRDLNLNSKAIDYIQGIAEYMVNREV